MSPTEIVFILGLFACGAVAGLLSRRGPLSGWAAPYFPRSAPTPWHWDVVFILLRTSAQLARSEHLVGQPAVLRRICLPRLSPCPAEGRGPCRALPRNP